MKEAIERVMAELEKEHSSRVHQAKYSSAESLKVFNQGAECGLFFAIDRLKAVIADGTDNSSRVSATDGEEAEQVPREENGS